MSKMADALHVVSLSLLQSLLASLPASTYAACFGFLLLLSRLMRGAPIRKVGQHCERDN